MILSFLHTAVVFVLVFTVLVFFHELGHFLAAKFFRMKVHEFGFGLPIPGTKRLCRFAFDGETEYTIWPFLFGGFVRIAGMEIDTHQATTVRDEMDKIKVGPPDQTIFTDAEEEARPGTVLGTTNAHTLRQEAAEVADAIPDGFNDRPIYQRFGVILAGPVFSFLLGWFALCLLGFTTGIPDKTRMTVADYAGKNTVAETAGIRLGDAITGVDGKPADHAEDVLDAIHDGAGKPLRLTITDKEGQTRIVTVVPKAETVEGVSKPIGRIGITPDIETVTYRHQGIAESFQGGTNMTGRWFSMMAQLIKSGAIKNNVGGTVAIVRETHNAAQKGGFETLGLLGQLSLSLGLFNLLPIPILDGGHLSLMMVEAVRRRKLTAEQQGRVAMTGFAILAALFILINSKDIFNLFKHS